MYDISVTESIIQEMVNIAAVGVSDGLHIVLVVEAWNNDYDHDHSQQHCNIELIKWAHNNNSINDDETLYVNHNMD